MNYKHGKRRSRAYSSWCSMKQRCLNPNFHQWNDYGGRGIRVCAAWMEFEAFYKDMGDPPDGSTLDRWPDGNGNYEPGNCRWATRVQQRNNRRDVRLIESGGVSLTMAQWSKRSGIKLRTIHARIAKGWDPAIAVAYPLVLGRSHCRSGSPAYAFGAERDVRFSAQEEAA